MKPTQIQLLYFAWLRVQIGASEERIDTQARSVAELIDELRQRSEGHAGALANISKLRVAVNQQLVELDAAIQPGDEVAIFPPMTGG